MADNALHEYVHHLQDRLPGFDDIFQQLHRRRTAGDPALPLRNYGGRGREDDYVDDYFGREYDHNSVKHRPVLEVVTRAFQLLFHRFKGPDGWTAILILGLRLIPLAPVMEYLVFRVQADV